MEIFAQIRILVEHIKKEIKTLEKKYDCLNLRNYTAITRRTIKKKKILESPSIHWGNVTNAVSKMFSEFIANAIL